MGLASSVNQSSAVLQFCFHPFLISMLLTPLRYRMLSERRFFLYPFLGPLLLLVIAADEIVFGLHLKIRRKEWNIPSLISEWYMSKSRNPSILNQALRSDDLPYRSTDNFCCKRKLILQPEEELLLPLQTQLDLCLKDLGLF